MDYLKCLIDCGFDEICIKECLNLINKGSTEELLKFLDRQRGSLLNELHIKQDELNCLDYLMLSINKSIKENKNGK